MFEQFPAVVEDMEEQLVVWRLAGYTIEEMTDTRVLVEQFMYERDPQQTWQGLPGTPLVVPAHNWTRKERPTEAIRMYLDGIRRRPVA